MNPRKTPGGPLRGRASRCVPLKRNILVAGEVRKGKKRRQRKGRVRSSASTVGGASAPKGGTVYETEHEVGDGGEKERKV